MKKLINFLITVLSAFVFTGCEFAGDVVRTGYYSGIFLVVFIIVVIIFFITTVSKRK